MLLCAALSVAPLPSKAWAAAEAVVEMPSAVSVPDTPLPAAPLLETRLAAPLPDLAPPVPSAGLEPATAAALPAAATMSAGRAQLVQRAAGALRTDGVRGPTSALGRPGPLVSICSLLRQRLLRA